MATTTTMTTEEIRTGHVQYIGLVFLFFCFFGLLVGAGNVGDHVFLFFMFRREIFFLEKEERLEVGALKRSNSLLDWICFVSCGISLGDQYAFDGESCIFDGAGENV